MNWEKYIEGQLTVAEILTNGIEKEPGDIVIHSDNSVDLLLKTPDHTIADPESGLKESIGWCSAYIKGWFGEKEVWVDLVFEAQPKIVEYHYQEIKNALLAGAGQ